jgi:hypothetical protein
MPTNWSDLDFDDIAARAAKKTDDELASKISSLSKMNDDEVKKLFPESADIAKLVKLMNIVKSAESRNTKINNIKNNLEEVGGVILTILDKFV